MSPIETAERKLIDLAMVRLEEWQEQHPDGLIEEGDGAMKPKGLAFIKACIELQALRREPQPSEKDVP